MYSVKKFSLLISALFAASLFLADIAIAGTVDINTKKLEGPTLRIQAKSIKIDPSTQSGMRTGPVISSPPSGLPSTAGEAPPPPTMEPLPPRQDVPQPPRYVPPPPPQPPNPALFFAPPGSTGGQPATP